MNFMNLLLIFLALPIATIILSLVLLKVLKCPSLVAATFFAIYLILTYAVFGTDFLILAIIYTILSYVTTIIARAICNIIARINSCCNRETENSLPCFCCSNDEYNSCCSSGNNNNGRSGNNNYNCNGLNTANQTRFTLTTNQANPVFYLTNRTNNCARRNNCCLGRR